MNPKVFSVKLLFQERRGTFKLICILMSLFFGTTARLAVSQRGYNFDFESYQLVVAADEQGLTPWQTNRYNYGPIWFYILEIFDCNILFKVFIFLLDKKCKDLPYRYLKMLIKSN